MTTKDRIKLIFEKLVKPTRADLRAAIAECALMAADLEPYLPNPAGFPYGRSLMFQSKYVEVLAMNWADQECAPHDHGPHSWGWVAVLEGRATHTLYSLDRAHLVQRKRTVKVSGELFFAPRGIIHSMGNARSAKLVTLHAYSPPIQGMRVYDSQRCRSCTVRDSCGAWWPDENKGPVPVIQLSNLAVQNVPKLGDREM